MGLDVTPTNQCLEKKVLLFGFEIADLLIIFLSLAILDLSIGRFLPKILSVWLPTIVLGWVIKWAKKGKPDNYLLHLIKYQFSPGHLSAFKEPSCLMQAPQLKGKINVDTCR